MGAGHFGGGAGGWQLWRREIGLRGDARDGFAERLQDQLARAPPDLGRQQIEPVPAIKTGPGAPPVAPYRAISASVTTSTELMPSPSRLSRTRSRRSARRTPARPTSAATMSVRRTPAASHA